MTVKWIQRDMQMALKYLERSKNSSLMRLPTVSEAHPAARAHFPSGWPHTS